MGEEKRKWSDLSPGEKAAATKTEPNEARFWSGRSSDDTGNDYSGEKNAERLAKEDGGKTLEMKLDEHNIDQTSLTPADWREASESFADGASGDVKCYKGDQLKPGNVYEGNEKDAINENKGINSITEVDNVTGESAKSSNSRNPDTGNLEDANGNSFVASSTTAVKSVNEGAGVKRDGPHPSSAPPAAGAPDTKLIDVGKIKIVPFDFERIIEVRIEKKLNEHSTLYVCGYVRDEQQFNPVSNSTEGVKVVCENNGLVYFKGVLQNVKVTCIDAVYRLEAYAISNTILLDTVRHKRSFQDNGQDYQAIVKKVIADESGSVVYNADALTVENIILQYNETDWEFTKRLASHTNDVLIPIIDDNPKFHLGATDQGSAKLEVKDYAVSRIFDLIRHFKAPGKIEKDKDKSPLELSDDDVTIYTVETDVFVGDIGEKFNLNGIDLRVCHLSLTFENSALTVVYTLCPKAAISAPKFYNPAITGLILDGKVKEVENDTLKLKLDNDTARGVEEDTGEAHFFKYATGYSMEKHTGWYVMPEEDDIVQLLFPIEDEKYAYATSSIRQEDTDRTTDYMVKYLRTSYKKEIKMDKDEILISAKDDDTFVRVIEGEGIRAITTKDVKIICDGTMDVNSKKDMSITTDTNLSITAKNSILLECGNSKIKMSSGGIVIKADMIDELS